MSREKSYVPQDYNFYVYSGKEYLSILGKSAFSAAAVGWLFYDSLIAGLGIFAAGIVWNLVRRTAYIEGRRRALTIQFKDALSGISAALTAGYSAENAIGEALKDLRRQYPENALIVREFIYMGAQMKAGRTAEEVFTQLANRSGVEEIRSFAAVFAAAKRGGGNMIAVLQKSIGKIRRGIEIRNEIRAGLAAKRYETLILKGMPFVIIGYLRLSSPGFLSPMYHNAAGIWIMSVLLLLYIGCTVFADKMMEIEA